LKLFWALLLILWPVYSSNGISAQESFPSAAFGSAAIRNKNYPGGDALGTASALGNRIRKILPAAYTHSLSIIGTHLKQINC